MSAEGPLARPLPDAGAVTRAAFAAMAREEWAVLATLIRFPWSTGLMYALDLDPWGERRATDG